MRSRLAPTASSHIASSATMVMVRKTSALKHEFPKHSARAREQKAPQISVQQKNVAGFGNDPSFPLEQFEKSPPPSTSHSKDRHRKPGRTLEEVIAMCIRRKTLKEPDAPLKNAQAHHERACDLNHRIGIYKSSPMSDMNNGRSKDNTRGFFDLCHEELQKITNIQPVAKWR